MTGVLVSHLPSFHFLVTLEMIRGIGARGQPLNPYSFSVFPHKDTRIVDLQQSFTVVIHSHSFGFHFLELIHPLCFNIMHSNRYVTSGLVLLSGLFIASEVNGDDGPFSMTVSSPEVCTASTFTYSSQRVMATGSFDIDPGGYGMGDLGQKWNFSVSAGIILDGDDWGSDGQNLDKWIVQNPDGSYTFTVPTDGTWRNHPELNCVKC